MRTPDLYDSIHHFPEGTIFPSLCSSDSLTQESRGMFGNDYFASCSSALLCQEAVNQGSDDNYLAEGLASGTH